MQFGRIIGAGLAALGVLLFFLQLSFFLASREHASPRGETKPAHRVPLIPGIVGGALVIGGSIIFVKARREDEPDPEHAVK